MGGGHWQCPPLLRESEKLPHLRRCLRLKISHRILNTARNFSPCRLVSKAVYRILFPGTRKLNFDIV